MPTIGEVLYVKSTEEPVVFVASRVISPDDVGKFPSNTGSGVIYVVRRPVVSESGGVQYKFFDFLAEELETARENTQRYYERLKFKNELAMADFGPTIIGNEPPKSSKPS